MNKYAVAYKAFGIEPVVETTRKFEYLDMVWNVDYDTRWTNGGFCIEIEQSDTHVGVALLMEGRGDYARYQRAPHIRWLPSDFLRFLDKNRRMLRKRDCTGVFHGIVIPEKELNSQLHDSSLLRE